MWDVRDREQQTIALACLTSPSADKIVGYAGPNNVLLLMDPAGQVTGAHLLNSVDTIDHVERVAAATDFWNQFHGQSLGGQLDQKIDGVSGATLTSLAIAEAIEMRLSGKRPSLRFPQPLTLDEVQALIPEASRLSDSERQPGLVDVYADKDKLLASILRTGPLVDDKIGYQGPTELIMVCDEHQRVTKVKLRSSFDNEPYVRYTRMEASFWSKFVGRTLLELSQLDLESEGIEGVSGATMTSMAAAETVRATAVRHLQELNATQARTAERSWNWSPGEIATALLALLVIPWSFSKLRGQRKWRFAWQLLALSIMVGLSGNLISLALLAGWTRSLPPLTLAPGLVILVGVAMIMSAAFGRNVYCDHVCPHGFLQQWLARWRRGRSVKREQLVQISNAPITKPPRAGEVSYVVSFA